jgi:hypothetical protein
MKCHYLLIALVSLFPLLVGCGGGGGNGDDQQDEQQDEQQFEEQTIVLDTTRALSGFISENGFVSNNNDAFAGTIPDLGGFLEERGILSFDLSSIPDGATLVSAELSALQGAPTGTPYAQVVRIIVDHINGNDGVLNFIDFASTPLSTILTPPLSEDDTEERKLLDITDQVENDLLQGRDATTLRLRGQAINPLTAGNNDLVDPVDLARFLTDAGETQLTIVITVAVQNP